MRWRQDAHTGKMVPMDEAAVIRDGGSSIHIFKPFRSHVDGSEITSEKSLREHNKRNNVVQTAEFGDKHFDDARKKRDDFYQGKHTTAESWERKAEIYETWTRAERNN